MHGSRNVVFVAVVDAALVNAVEAQLIWDHRDTLVYNNVGKRSPPHVTLTLEHRGECPRFGS
jgi:hypothetical protein